MRSKTSKILSTLALILLGGCDEGVLAPAGAVGASERIVLLDSVAIMLAIVLPTIVAILAFVWWFRATNKRATYRPTWDYSGRLELLVWSIPALTVFFLGGVAWIGSHELDPGQALESKTKPLDIQVVSLDWKWLFIYPELNIASLNQLIVPAATPLHFSLTSASVFNAFFIPRLGSQIYTMNGMVTQLNLIADRPGVYPGLSAHFSGDGFSDMHFNLEARPAADFERWVTDTRSDGPHLDEPTYRGLLAQSQNVQPLTYSNVSPDLFQAIVSQKLPPGDGPKLNQSAQPTNSH